MDIVLRAALMYLVVLILLRLTTQRIMRSATPLDMVVIFFFGGMAVPPILGDDRSITGAVLALCTIAGLHTLLSHLKRIWPTVGMVAEGNPVVIYSNGTLDDAKMRRRRIDPRDVMAEMRQHGITSLEDVQSAIIEHTGAITLVPKRRQS
ncbi:MAG TPA: YetF domain-containing protein [Steroidobacteraceae bacterium]|nr:YetF domain-containing protein [Steroidobacteraceae bacterium]